MRTRFVVAASVGFAVLIATASLARAQDAEAAKKATEAAANKVQAATRKAAEARQETETAIKDLTADLKNSVLQRAAAAPIKAASPPRFNPTPVATPRAAAAAAPVGFAFPVPDQNPAGYVHTLLFSNTNDNLGPQSIGPGVRANRDFLNSLLDIQCGSRRINEADLHDGTFTLANARQAIQNMQVAPNDVVFCYISTHGAFDNSPQPEDYLAPCGNNYAEIRRRDIMDAIRATKPRLIVLISDSCGTLLNIHSAAPLSAAPPPPVTNALFTLLFYTRGEISINAAVPGREAYYLASPYPGGGGYFTRGFVTAAFYSPGKTWQEFFTYVSNQSQKPSAGLQPPPCLFNGSGFPVNDAGKPLP